MIILVAICKNEQEKITNFLNEWASISNAVVIQDTGSTDNTVELIEKWKEENPKIEVTLGKTIFKNFVENYNNVLEIAYNKYPQGTFIFSAIDETLYKEDKYEFSLELETLDYKEAIQTTITGKQINEGLQYTRIRAWRGTDLKFNGPYTHEYLDTKDYDIKESITTILHEPKRSKDYANKFARDEKLLKQYIEDYLDPFKEENDLTNYMRANFYLGNTYQDTNQIPKAIEAYKKFLNLYETRNYNHESERYLSSYYIAWLSYLMGEFEDSIKYCKLCINDYQEENPRPEAHWLSTKIALDHLVEDKMLLEATLDVVRQALEFTPNSSNMFYDPIYMKWLENTKYIIVDKLNKYNDKLFSKAIDTENLNLNQEEKDELVERFTETSDNVIEDTERGMLYEELNVTDPKATVRISNEHKVMANLKDKIKEKNQKHIENSLNTYFDKIYVINMRKDEDRLKNIKAILKENFNIKYDIIQGIDSQIFKTNNPYYGCGLTHVSIYNEVVRENYDRVLIIEDDLLPNVNAKDNIIHTMKYIGNYDVLFLGYARAEYDKVTKEYQTKARHIDSDFIRINDLADDYYGLHLYSISNSGAIKLLERFSTSEYNKVTLDEFINQDNGLEKYATKVNNGIQDDRIASSNLKMINFRNPKLWFNDTNFNKNETFIDANSILINQNKLNMIYKEYKKQKASTV